MSVLTSSLRYFTGYKVEHSMNESSCLLIADMGERISESSMSTILTGDCPVFSNEGELRGVIAGILSTCQSIDQLTITPPASFKERVRPTKNDEVDNQQPMPSFLSGHHRSMH